MFGFNNKSNKPRQIEVVKKWSRSHQSYFYYVYEDGKYMNLFAKEEEAIELAHKLEKDWNRRDEVILTIPLQ